MNQIPELDSIYSQDVRSMMSYPSEILNPSTLIRQPASVSLSNLATRTRIRSLGFVTTGRDQFSTVMPEVPFIDGGASHEPSGISQTQAIASSAQIKDNVMWYFDADVRQQRDKLEHEITEALRPLFERELPQENRLRYVLGLEPWPRLQYSASVYRYREYRLRAEWSGPEYAGLLTAESKVFEAAVGILVEIVVQQTSADLAGTSNGILSENDAIGPGHFDTASNSVEKAAILNHIAQKLRVFHDNLQKDSILLGKWTEKIFGVWERMIRTHAAYPDALGSGHQINPCDLWEEQPISLADLSSLKGTSGITVEN